MLPTICKFLLLSKLSNMSNIESRFNGYRQNVERVSKFLYTKLESTGPQWRRILKSLSAIEFIIKNGSPPAVIQFKRDLYKISSLCNFSYTENGVDRGAAIRERVNLVVDMLS